MRTFGKALEAYFVEHGCYASGLPDVFPPTGQKMSFPTLEEDGFVVRLQVDNSCMEWMIIGTAADGVFEKELGVEAESFSNSDAWCRKGPPYLKLTYDPTNGLTSRGDVFYTKTDHEPRIE